MNSRKYYRNVDILALIFVFQIAFFVSVNGQKLDAPNPDLNVVGIELGDRESAKKFLKTGFSPRMEKDGSVSYYFYNKWATQVMKLSAPSMNDRFYITEIEVFRVSRKYTKPHFHTEDIKYFSTENGIFIGFKQSAMFMIAGIKNAGTINRFKPKHIVKMKGEPDERNKMDKKSEILVYRTSGVALKDEQTASYEASYKFYKKKLTRFKLKISPEKAKLAKK